ncbi:MAG: Hsp20 family protein, partial [Clostridia bacterium]|nr:Hsp20 family protein [Clostridia bacterium]
MSTYLPTVFGENLLDMFDDFDRDFFRGFNRPEHALYGKNASRMMKTDVKETDEGYEVAVDLPGFNKEEIKLELNKGYL